MAVAANQHTLSRARAQSFAKTVHFDQDCILIPDQPKLHQRFSSKTYALPLWRASPDKEPAQIKFRMPRYAPSP